MATDTDIKGQPAINPNTILGPDVSKVDPFQETHDIAQAAFPPELSTRIRASLGLDQTYHELIRDISRHVTSLQHRQVPPQDQPANPKKRKLEDESVTIPKAQQNGSQPAFHNGDLEIHSIFECRDVSVQIPARKKLKLSIQRTEVDDRMAAIALVNQSTEAVEHRLQPHRLEAVFVMPVPDKTVRQNYFVVMPKAGELSSDGKPAEPMVFTMAETPVSASVTHCDRSLPTSEDDTHVSLTERALERILVPHHKRITRPDAAEFASSRPQPHRKGEKAYHVNAHSGSKEGYLYFLPNGILFGFKKPVRFFPFSAIESISYTSVLQRTFNLVIAYSEHTDGLEPQETKQAEFSMLDQEDFANIDDYIKRHGLNDASMAADRRAKAYNVNKVAKEDGVNGDAAAGGVDEDGMTELQKAEQQLQDEEDEEEEDYEASGGESDGEGEESGEESEDAEGEAEEEEDEE
ncbi:uncharacterized protein LTR77_004596 [Saxophila tyrrhenica]|uniref:Histone chaperone RTT106/FACT complex subunit SPT16-like middle domain-containing protein n=1 Tax=Saxophila tyrrhenica TaxID=1690608 RepID=A0AAV9PDI3_9PEZI|nr:hypothetical protein LTR77_004596 [Saxophila tyrrhenica]